MHTLLVAGRRTETAVGRTRRLGVGQCGGGGSSRSGGGGSVTTAAFFRRAAVRRRAERRSTAEIGTPEAAAAVAQCRRHGVDVPAAAAAVL